MEEGQVWDEHFQCILPNFLVSCTIFVAVTMPRQQTGLCYSLQCIAFVKKKARVRDGCLHQNRQIFQTAYDHPPLLIFGKSSCRFFFAQFFQQGDSTSRQNRENAKNDFKNPFTSRRYKNSSAAQFPHYTSEPVDRPLNMPVIRGAKTQWLCMIIELWWRELALVIFAMVEILH